jgi:hypothetical protein
VKLEVDSLMQSTILYIPLIFSDRLLRNVECRSFSLIKVCPAKKLLSFIASPLLDNTVTAMPSKNVCLRIDSARVNYPAFSSEGYLTHRVAKAFLIVKRQCHEMDIFCKGLNI